MKKCLFLLQSLFSSHSSETLVYFHPTIIILFSCEKQVKCLCSFLLCRETLSGYLSRLRASLSFPLLFFFFLSRPEQQMLTLQPQHCRSDMKATNIQVKILKALGFRSPCTEIWRFMKRCMTFETQVTFPEQYRCASYSCFVHNYPLWLIAWMLTSVFVGGRVETDTVIKWRFKKNTRL